LAASFAAGFSASLGAGGRISVTKKDDGLSKRAKGNIKAICDIIKRNRSLIHLDL
jgi:hypothetical protein